MATTHRTKAALELFTPGDYLIKPASAEDLLRAINARLDRHNEKEQAAMAKMELKSNFESAEPR